MKATHTRVICKAQTEQLDPGSRSLVAIVSTAAIDRDKEILIPSGADLTEFRKNPVVLWAHDSSRPPIARAQWIKATKDDVRARVQFADTPFAAEVFRLYQGGFLKAFSVGFNGRDAKSHIPTEAEIKRNPALSGVSRIYDKWPLVEFSAVPIPANPEALAMAVSKGLSLPETRAEFDLPGCDEPEPVIVVASEEPLKRKRHTTVRPAARKRRHVVVVSGGPKSLDAEAVASIIADGIGRYIGRM